MELSKVGKRDQLKPRREPYWQTLGTGRALGYRQSKKGGTWIARRYDPFEVRNQYSSLGDFGHLPPTERYATALTAARSWFERLDKGGVASDVTFRDACESYAAKRPDAAKRFQRYVYNHSIAKIPLSKLADRHVREWRDQLEKSPALVSRSKKGEPVTRPRAPATFNRDIAPVRAALNAALKGRLILEDHAWKFALSQLETSPGSRPYLSKDECRALLATLSPDLEVFARVLCQIPLRPGALAQVNVEDVNIVTGEIFIRSDKAGAGRKFIAPSRVINLAKEHGKNKLPKAPLFARWDGARWDKDKWKDEFKKAASAAGLPCSMTMYSLRHSCITHLAQNGTNLMTLALMAGTSLLMIQKHYGHLDAQHALECLERNAI